MWFVKYYRNSLYDSFWPKWDIILRILCLMCSRNWNAVRIRMRSLNEHAKAATMRKANKIKCRECKMAQLLRKRFLWHSTDTYHCRTRQLHSWLWDFPREIKLIIEKENATELNAFFRLLILSFYLFKWIPKTTGSGWWKTPEQSDERLSDQRHSTVRTGGSGTFVISQAMQLTRGFWRAVSFIKTHYLSRQKQVRCL